MKMLRWKLFDFAPTLLALWCYRASPASFGCPYDFSRPSLPFDPVFVRFVAAICNCDRYFIVRILGLFISFISACVDSFISLSCISALLFRFRVVYFGVVVSFRRVFIPFISLAFISLISALLFRFCVIYSGVVISFLRCLFRRFCRLYMSVMSRSPSPPVLQQQCSPPPPVLQQQCSPPPPVLQRQRLSAPPVLQQQWSPSPPVLQQRLSAPPVLQRQRSPLDRSPDKKKTRTLEERAIGRTPTCGAEGGRSDVPVGLVSPPPRSRHRLVSPPPRFRRRLFPPPVGLVPPPTGLVAPPTGLVAPLPPPPPPPQKERHQLLVARGSERPKTNVSYYLHRAVFSVILT
jgi:hypothetical protein